MSQRSQQNKSGRNDVLWLSLALGVAGLALLAAYSLWLDREQAEPAVLAPRQDAGAAPSMVLRQPAAKELTRRPSAALTTQDAAEIEGPSLEAEYARLLLRLRSMSEQELDEIGGSWSGTGLGDSALGMELSDLSQRFLNQQWALVEQHLDPEIIARQRASLSGGGCSTAEFLARTAEVTALMAAEDDDLSRAVSAALLSEDQEKILAILVWGATGQRGSGPVHVAYMQLLERVVARQESLLAKYLVYPLLLSTRYQCVDPYPVWLIAVNSDIPDLMSKVLLGLRRFPVEQVEPLLLLGLRDPRWLVRFGALEGVRYYGVKGTLSDPYQMAMEVRAVAEEYADQLGRSVLLLEVIAAIGQADPVLLEMMNPATDVRLRHLAATNFVLGADGESARQWIAAWLDDDILFDSAIYALGALPGEAADNMLMDLVRQGGSPETTARVLSAMSGRGPQFAMEFLGAIDADNDVVRQTALTGLLDLIGDERLDSSAEKKIVEGLATASAKNPDEQERQRALLGLAFQGGQQAVAALQAQFLSEQDPEVRGLAGSLLLLASADDPARQDWVDGRIEGESIAVRLAMTDFKASLKDPSRRQGLLDELLAGSGVWEIADAVTDTSGGAKDPIGLRARRIRRLRAAFDTWAKDDT